LTSQFVLQGLLPSVPAGAGQAVIPCGGGINQKARTHFLLKEFTLQIYFTLCFSDTFIGVTPFGRDPVGGGINQKARTPSGRVDFKSKMPF